MSLEIKSLYGYDSILFDLVADSRRGIHAQVDIRKYFTPGGHKPMDEMLVGRTMKVLEKAIYFQHKLSVIHSHHTARVADGGTGGGSNSGSEIVTTKGADNKDPITDRIVHVNDQFPGDFVVGPALYSDEASRHILGPFQSNQTQVCESMLFSRIRKVLVPSSGHSFHCDICTTYVVRR